MTKESIGMFEINLRHKNNDETSMPYHGEFIGE